MYGVPDRFGPDNALRRCLAAALSLGLHGLALVLALLFATSAAKPPPPDLNLASFDVTTPGPPAPTPPKPPQPKKVPPTPRQPIVIPPPLIELPTLSPMVVELLAQSDAQAASGACDLTAPVQAALQTSPEVQALIPSIPSERRSVANAIAVWNQIWVTPDAQLQEQALASIRTAVVLTVAAASEACRLQPQGGPRLIYLPGPLGTETTVLALGSGEWTWQQVADSAQPEFALEGDGPLPGQPATGVSSEFTSFWRSIFKPGI